MVLTGANHDPAEAEIAALYADLSERASFAFTASVDGRIYARHGTSIDTRLTVIDRIPGLAPLVPAGHAASLAELLALIEAKLPPRPPLFLLSGHPENGPAIRRRHVSDSRARKPVLPFRPPRRFRRTRTKSAMRRAKPRPIRSSATGFMNRMRCRRSRLPAQSRTRRSSCSRPPWPRSGRRFPPTGPCCRNG